MTPVDKSCLTCMWHNGCRICLIAAQIAGREVAAEYEPLEKFYCCRYDRMDLCGD